MQMRPPECSGFLNRCQLNSRKEPLPDEFLRRARTFSQGNSPGTPKHSLKGAIQIRASLFMDLNGQSFANSRPHGSRRGHRVPTSKAGFPFGYKAEMQVDGVLGLTSLGGGLVFPLELPEKWLQAPFLE